MAARVICGHFTYRGQEVKDYVYSRDDELGSADFLLIQFKILNA